MYPHPRGKASREEVGCFMFFAFPALLILGVIQLFFSVVGWLFEQTRFYIVLAVVIAASIISWILR